MAYYLRPALTPIGEAKYVVDMLVRALHKPEFHHQVGIVVAEVIKGGSLGHGTVVEEDFDIDLVLYSDSLSVADAVTNGYGKYFDKMNAYLKEQFPGMYSPEEEPYTNVAIKFTMKYGTSPIGVDLILSPYFSDQHQLLTTLRKVDKSDRLRMFSASASKWQTNFLSHQTGWVKQLIRRAKAWRNIQWKYSKEGKPKSYCLSILVIIAYDRLPPEKKVVRRKGLKKLVPTLTRNFKVLIKEIWSEPHLNIFAAAGRHLQDMYSDLLPDTPRIIDPINPANNLYLSGVFRCEKERNKWGPFMRKVDDLDLTPKILRQH